MARTGIMLCHPFDEKRLSRWRVPYVLVQPKLDGERCRTIIENNEVILLSSEQNEILSVPHINEGLRDLKLGTCELDGELYTHDSNFNSISSIVGRTVNLHPDFESVSLNIFDVVNNLQQADRTRWLSKFPQSPWISVLDTDLISINQIEDYLEKYKEENYEGIIIRHPYGCYERKRSNFIMKFKPKKQDIYKIIGWEEAISEDGTPLKRIGSLWCEKDGEKFKVSCGATDHATLRRWFRNPGYLLEMYANVHYQNLTPGRQIPRFGRMNLEIDLMESELV